MLYISDAFLQLYQIKIELQTRSEIVLENLHQNTIILKLKHGTSFFITGRCEGYQRDIPGWTCLKK